MKGFLLRSWPVDLTPHNKPIFFSLLLHFVVVHWEIRALLSMQKEPNRDIKIKTKNKTKRITLKLKYQKYYTTTNHNDNDNNDN